MNWINYKESKPEEKEGEKILAWNNYAFEAEFIDGIWCSLGGDEVIWWMPSPPEPERSHCMICNKPVESYKPQMCCNGHDCGCMGQPMEPCLCSSKCEEALFDVEGTFEDRRIKHGIKLHEPINQTYSTFFNTDHLEIHASYQKGDPPFITGVKGSVIIGILEEIEQGMIDNDVDIFADGNGDYIFKAAHQQGQQSFPETGQWDFPPHWELEQLHFKPNEAWSLKNNTETKNLSKQEPKGSATACCSPMSTQPI